MAVTKYGLQGLSNERRIPAKRELQKRGNKTLIQFSVLMQISSSSCQDSAMHFHGVLVNIMSFYATFCDCMLFCAMSCCYVMPCYLAMLSCYVKLLRDVMFYHVMSCYYAILCHIMFSGFDM